MSKDMRMEFRLFDQGKGKPLYIWQESAMEENTEWAQVATILESACFAALGVKPLRESRRWNILGQTPKLSKIVTFGAMFHSQMESAGFDAVSLCINVGEMDPESYEGDMPLQKAEKAIGSWLSAAAVLDGAIAEETGMPAKWMPPKDTPEDSLEDVELEAELDAKLGASPVPEGHSANDIHRVKRRFHLNTISDTAAIRQLCDVIDSREDVWFTRGAFEQLLDEIVTSGEGPGLKE